MFSHKFKFNLAFVAVCGALFFFGLVASDVLKEANRGKAERTEQVVKPKKKKATKKKRFIVQDFGGIGYMSEKYLLTDTKTKQEYLFLESEDGYIAVVTLGNTGQ